MPAIETLKALGFEVEIAPGKTLTDGTHETVVWVRDPQNNAVCLELEQLEFLMSEVEP